MEPYRIMVVDDSAFMRKIVSDLIEQDPSFKVVSTARNGYDAVEQISACPPDLVTMDVEMPDMNGLEALKVIMERAPLPVIMLSGINEQGTRETIMALELGAFDFIRKPSASTSSYDIEQVGNELREQISTAMNMRARRIAREAIQKPVISAPPPIPERVNTNKDLFQVPSDRKVSSQVKPKGRLAKMAELGQAEQISVPSATSKRKVSEDSASKIDALQKELRNNLNKISKKKGNKEEVSQAIVNSPPVEKSEIRAPSKTSHLVDEKVVDKGIPERSKDSVMSAGFTDLVAIGTSTGGPKALKAVLESIPHNFPAPIVIVQHMPANFTKSLAQRLNSLCDISVEEAEEGMELQRGKAYIAPGGFHMNVTSGREGRYRISLSKGELRNGHRPSVDVLYESLLPLQSLKRHVVLLTGMGSDGAKVMKRLHDTGVTSTFAESEETCVVYGMPRCAIDLKCVNHVLPLHEIGPKLVQVVK